MGEDQKEAPEGVSVLAWDGDALRVSPDGDGDPVTLRFSFEAIAEYEERYGSIYGVLDDFLVSRLVAFLSAFGAMSLRDAFDAYGRIGQTRTMEAAAFVVERLLAFGGLRVSSGEAEADPKA